MACAIRHASVGCGLAEGNLSEADFTAWIRANISRGGAAMINGQNVPYQIY